MDRDECEASFHSPFRSRTVQSPGLMRFTCGYPFPVGGGGGGRILCARFFGVGHYGEQGEGWAVSWTNDTPRAEALNLGKEGTCVF